MTDPVDRTSDLLKTNNCAKCGVAIAPGKKFCSEHRPSSGSGKAPNNTNSLNDQLNARDIANENLPASLDLTYKDKRIFLKVAPTPQAGQFFSSENFEDWVFENISDLPPIEKHALVTQLNKLLTQTFEQLAKEYELDYKLVKGPGGKLTYKLINKNGSELTPEQQNKIQKNMLTDMPRIFNSLPQDLINKFGSSIRLIMISAPVQQANENNVLGQTPLATKLTPGQGQSKDKKKQEEDRVRAYSSSTTPTPLTDPHKLTPKTPLE